MLQEIYEFTMRLKEDNHWSWRYVYKFNKLMVGVLYPLYLKVQKEKGTDKYNDIIVSLTSYPARINSVWITIASLMRQTMKPSQIFLWLSEDQFPGREQDLPQNLKKLVDRGLEIRFCKGDLRSHKKYFYTFQEYSDSNIIIADDDIIYPPEHIEKLWKKHKEYPDCICCHYGHVITFDDEGHILPYERWNGGVDGYTIPSMGLMPVGCNGVLYPPHSIDERAFNEEAIKETCIQADDIWLKAMGVLKGTKAVTCNEGALVYFGLLQTRGTGLYKENADGNKNNEAIRNILDKYPEVEKKLFKRN